MNKENIEKYIWNASNKLRGTIDAANYKDYLLTLLFWKYISDLSLYVQEEKKTKTKNKRTQDILTKNDIRYIEPELRLDHFAKNKYMDDIAKQLNDAMIKIENNHELFRGTFQDVDFNSPKLGTSKERNRLIAELLEIFTSKELNFTHNIEGDVIGDIYQWLLGQFASSAGKKGGEFYTPSQVSKLLAILVKPESNNSIYDPTVGSGSLLIQAAKLVEGNNKDKMIDLYGQEKNNQTVPLAKMTMIINNYLTAQIETGDTLTNPRFKDKNKLRQFDRVVANPPFSAHIDIEELKNGAFNERFKYGLPGKNQGDWAFVQHMIASLKDKGRLSVVLPIGPLFRSGSEGKIREQVIKDGLVESVVLLPSSLFYGTSIGACILTVSKNNKAIRFIDASKLYKADKNQNVLENKHIDEIVNYLDKDKKNFSKLVKINELEDYSLNVTTYTKEAEVEKLIDLSTLQKEILDLKKEIDTKDKDLFALLKKEGIWKK